MPNRVIREGLLDSDRYWSVPIEARELYRHLQLLADDFGCVSLAYAFVRRRCFDSNPSLEKVSMLIGLIQDADLLRVYEHEGARYGFIPRFRQRLQRFTLKHPIPSDAVLQGDPDAIVKFNRIREESLRSTDGQRLPTVAQPLPTVGQPPEVEGKKKETKRARSAPPVLPEWVDPKTWGAFLDMRVKKRAKATHHAQSLILRELETFRAKGHDPNTILEESIKRSWTGVFEPTRPQQRQGCPRRVNSDQACRFNSGQGL